MAEPVHWLRTPLGRMSFAVKTVDIMSDFPPNLSIRPLTVEDVDKCVALETKGFSEHERASREKIEYRLTVCPELCSGLFIREYNYRYNSINLPEVAERKEKEHEDADSGKEDEDELPASSSVVNETLIGHILATKIHSNRITDSSMAFSSDTDKNSGHQESSRFVGIHALVIDPEWQGNNLGTLLMHDYIQKLSNQDLGDKVVIIAHKELVPFYEKIGFNDHGASACQFAGETWNDLTIDLIPEEED